MVVSWALVLGAMGGFGDVPWADEHCNTGHWAGGEQLGPNHYSARTDRFVEGHLLEVLHDGHPIQLLHRIRGLVDDRT